MDEFKTPVTKRVKQFHGESGSVSKAKTPAIVIPPSPCMKKLGYGTGKDYRYSVLHKLNAEISTNNSILMFVAFATFVC